MTPPTQLIKKKRKLSFEANFNIPETVASCFHNNREIQRILQIKVGVV